MSISLALFLAGRHRVPHSIMRCPVYFVRGLI